MKNCKIEKKVGCECLVNRASKKKVLSHAIVIFD